MKLLNNLYQIQAIEKDCNGTNYVIRLNCNDVIYKAHFPNYPVTPGVCIIQMAKELLEIELQTSLNIQKVKNAKFLTVLSPDKNPVVTFRIAKLTEDVNKNCFSAQFIVSSPTTDFSKLSILCKKK